MRAAFGKVNTLHTHAMPTVDRPLVTENLVGGEDGIDDNGLSLSKLIPNGFMFLEATGEVFQGNSTAFQSSQRSKLNYVGRLRGYRDLTEGTNLDLGTSIAFGPTDLGVLGSGLNKRLVGFDATFRYRPLRRAIYKRFQARTELVWSRQDLPGAAQANAFGFYGLGEYQFARRWYVGARYDRSGHVLQPTLKDTGESFFVTYWPSEFSQIRGQYATDQLRHRCHRQRIPVPVQLRDWCAWRARVLGSVHHACIGSSRVRSRRVLTMVAAHLSVGWPPGPVVDDHPGPGLARD